MNQILIEQRIYVTKEMKRKKKIYKTLYIISMITLIVLVLYYFMAEKERNDREGLSREIMQQINNDNTTVEERKIVVALNDRTEDPNATQIEIPVNTVQDQPSQEPITSNITTSNGQSYTTEATLSYPKLGISYPVLSEESEELLKISLCKYWGPSPNEVGNYCIVGHNYKSGKMFGKLSMASIGDQVELKDLSGKTIIYIVYNKYVVEPTDVSCTTQKTNGQREMTLITCTDYGKRRLVIKAREI